ncbi:Receptor-like protein kinase [Thalictrum thalictroides]|uniref:non-specific serine/threonine protein kinase n=1 Tax=Thalictrum thalictroides TaxID=46969 RepID=A0A7J6WKZ5_THATH|nr:Receptor-like protein kinase [Thalictrum thalictroides]
MTNSFKDTVGEGGYGCVFRGKLGDDGPLVAVKVLNSSKGNGEEFINEVATIDGSRGMCLYDKTTSKGLPVQCACGDDHKYLFDRTCPLNSTYSDEKKIKTASQGMATGLKVIIGVSTGVGGLLLILFLIYRQKFCMFYYLMISHGRNKAKGPTNVEVLLESYGCLTLQRYRYSDIKKITNSFKDTLGQGAYGRVFKGKLSDNGQLVAVKVLNESKGNGEEFVNEVATIGRTNHVNVVSLLGFCNEGTKRALVYEYMPNGSLEKFIYNEKISSTGSPTLGWEKLYEIAIGIARGLEYLHRGCNTRILHFDIKPHNILLDQDFCPKISDFGLAKLCPTRESIVSMVGARGTIGYIAPEVYCRNFGGVSHKSDVYSYGMMVLEMIGGRKNIDATMSNTSETYFPHWIYNHLKLYIQVEGTVSIKIEGSGETFEDEAAKKMIIVALWCIQTHPVDRPSISNVVEMLEGYLEDLHMPPNPFQDPPSRFSPSSSSINVT